tara:strand:+ start:311 stop:1426 length:1116 start_codon:yes stop_codon:yes gene_type:complete
LNKNLKIAIIGSRGYPYVYSGYETLVKELSERLVRKGHKVRVYCHSPLFKKKPRFVNGIELVYTPSFETKFFSQIINSFFSFIHVCFSEIDVVFVVNSANGPFGILTKLFRKKTCINVDGLEWLRPKWKGLGSIYFKISSKLSTVFFDKVITDSYEMRKIYKERFKKNSDVIAYGSTVKKTKSTDYLRKLNLDKNQYYLIVGRLIPDNNAKIIAKSFLKTSSKKKLVIVGDVPYNDSYANKVKILASEKIILTGYITKQDKLSQLYNNCFCYVHGHEFGGTNPTMINALESCVNILALNTTFNKEMLTNKTAIFFDKNTKSIIKGFSYFENKKNLSANVILKYKIEERYSWDYIVIQYLRVFKELTSSQSM